ncbi:MAG: hypothetical protein KAS49_07390 [Candidatus Cloacimonetes bacterium]|nr:hypothetical protein [Candidatus Cloacimonadota bacterium]
MKKSILILIIICVSSIIQAHEFSFSYKISGDENNSGEQERGWIFNFANLSWGDNSFSNYAFSINFTDLEFMDKADIVKAWVKFPISENANLILGKNNYSFSSMQSNGSCCGAGAGFSGAGTTSIFSFKHLDLDPSFMAKLDFEKAGFLWENYLVHKKFSNANFGSRISMKKENLHVGATLIAKSINETEHLDFLYEFDADLSLWEFVKISQQISKLDDEEKLRYFCLFSSEKKYSLSLLKNITPYAGLSYNEIDQNLIIGLNIKPIKDAFMKIEYNKTIDSDVAAQLDLQVGCTF